MFYFHALYSLLQQDYFIAYYTSVWGEKKNEFVKDGYIQKCSNVCKSPTVLIYRKNIIYMYNKNCRKQVQQLGKYREEKRMKREALTNKIAVVGVDGFDPKFAKRCMDKGLMPNLKKYIEKYQSVLDLIFYTDNKSFIRLSKSNLKILSELGINLMISFH